jgi:HAD superfamily hydrolase (TIGR01509 family)
MPGAVVFDMDGLLLDTERLYQEALGLAAVEAGLEVAAGLFEKTLGLQWIHCRAVLLAHYGGTFAVDAFQAIWIRHFWAIAETRLALKPGALALLDALAELGLPCAIATSSSRPTVERHLVACNLIGRFQAIVGRGDYVNGKPAPDPFLKAAEQLGVEAGSCLALEDSHNGVRSATSAGLMTIMVPDLLQPTAEMRRPCLHIVDDLHVVREFILATARRQSDLTARVC